MTAGEVSTFERRTIPRVIHGLITLSEKSDTSRDTKKLDLYPNIKSDRRAPAISPHNRLKLFWQRITQGAYRRSETINRDNLFHPF